jgi:hypothetical protein
MTPILVRERSVAKEMRQIRSHYSKDELDTLREDFTDTSLKRDDLEEQFSEIRKDFKTRIVEQRDKGKALALEIRNRYHDDEVECYLVPDFDAGMMEYYSVDTGEKVDERRLRPDERQATIFHQEPRAVNTSAN